MATISYTDSLFVNVMTMGRTLMSLHLSGFNSVKELMLHLHELLRQYSGKLLTLQLRNSTQGWSRTSSMLFSA